MAKRRKRKRNIGDNQDALATAQELVWQAYDTEDPQERIELASEAIELCDYCAEAYVCLAELAPSPLHAASMFRMGMDAGEVALGGSEGLAAYENQFWLAPETRAYMQARQGLAECLWALGDREEAIEHCCALLRMNPNDNQGIRYLLSGFYSELGQDQELQHLLTQYPDDDSAEWAFSRALLAFRNEGDTEAARQALRDAHAVNAYVADYLLGHKTPPRDLPCYITPGEESEAISYISNGMCGWRAASGAISWMRRVLHIAMPEARPCRRPTWKQLRASVAELPLAEGEIWQADVRRTAIGLPADEKTESIWTLIITDPINDEIVALDGFEDEGRPTPTQSLTKLLELMDNPHAGDPRRPSVIQLRQKTLLKTWESKLEPIEIRCDLTVELDHIDHVVATIEGAQAENSVSPEQLEARAGELGDLPQQPDQRWQLDWRQLSMWINDEGDPRRPWMAMITCPSEDLILAQNLRLEEPTPQWLWQTLLAALLTPAAGVPHLPGMIEVGDDQKRDFLRAHLEPLGIDCVVSNDLDHLDVVLGEMQASLASGERITALIDTPGVGNDHVRGYFEAAAGYYQAAPWRHVPGDMPIKISSKGLSTNTWYAVIMGQSGMTLGLAMYEDLETLEAILCDEDGAQRRSSGLSVMFGEPFEIAVRDLQAAEQGNWPVAGPEAYPLALRVNPGMAIRPPLAWELKLLEACMRGLPRFVELDREEPVQMVIPTAGGEMDLEISWVE